MSARGYLHHTSDSGTVVTVSTVGDFNDVAYALTWRSGENFTDVLCVEHVDHMQKTENYRSSSNSWGSP